MPDIPALAAAAAAGDARLPVQMKFPPGSALNFKVDTEEQKGSSPSTNRFPQICYLSIPLITIIATFVLNLFLPIVVFLFQLWFLLGLKFCIPPSISLSVGLDAQLQLELDVQIELAASLDVSLDVLADAQLEDALAASLNLAINGDVTPTIHPTTHVVTLDASAAGSPGVKMKEAMETSALLKLNRAITEDRKEEVDSRSIVAGLAFVPRVERWEVAA
jgi:hypothetical protein